MYYQNGDVLRSLKLRLLGTSQKNMIFSTTSYVVTKIQKLETYPGCRNVLIFQIFILPIVHLVQWKFC